MGAKYPLPEQYKDIKIVEQGPVHMLDKKHQLLDDAFKLLMVIIATAIYSLAVAWFLEPAHLVSLGLTAVAQIFNRLFLQFGLDIPLGVFVFIFNVPLCLVGFKYVSPRFVIFTLVSVVIMSLLLMGWIPVPEFIKDFTQTASDAPTAFNPNSLLLAILAGMFGGVGTGLALKFGGSTGGVDVVAQALKLRKNVSIGKFAVSVNIVLAIIAGGLLEGEWAITFVTFIFVILCYIVEEKVHTGYNTIRIDIITKNQHEMSDALIRGIGRGCTVLDVKGAFTQENKYDIFTVISYYELDKAKKIIASVDPEAFITIMPVKRVYGSFFRHTIS